MPAPPPSNRLGLVALSLAMLLPSLGTSIANVALPSLAAAFAASSQNVQWVVIAYLLALTALLVVAGRLGDAFGRRPMLLAGIAVFALASFGAALAPGLGALIAARAAQGVGAAILMSLTMASVGDLVPRERIGTAMGLLGTVSAVGTALGPSIGGLLLGAFGWPSIFLFSGAAGLAALLLGTVLLPSAAPAAPRRFAFDLPGMAVLVPSLTAYALAATLEPLTPANAAFALLAALGLAGFVRIEMGHPTPLLQLAMLAEPTMRSGLVTTALVSAIMMTTLVVGPFYLTGVAGLDPVRTGLAMTVGPAVAALAGIPAGRLADRFGGRAVLLAGLAGIIIGSALMVVFPPAWGALGYVGSLAVITAGYALFQAANNAVVMGSVAENARGVASALLALSRNLGLITGASAMGALFALGAGGIGLLHLPAAGDTGLRVAFLAALGLAVLAGATASWAGRSR